MNFVHLPSELQLHIAEKLESRELSHLSRTNHYFYSLCTPALERLAQEPRGLLCALWWAILHNYPPLVQLLLSKGYDINHLLYGQLYFGTALHISVMARNHPLITLFLENPALDMNKLGRDGDTALHKAIVKHDLEAVKLLHAGGVDLEIGDMFGRTALLLALKYEHEEFMIFMEHEETMENEEIIEFLVRNGANLNVLLPAGTEPYITFLQGLVWVGSERLVKLALEYGADPEVRDSWHKRAIDNAVEWGLTGIVDILREVSLLLDTDVQ
ncbi:ankyrin repeat-containing domain protein [Tuber borchii]|uniref:Ankyrin repeat-containing domain protein n=1 Tax=Tuber borchii TaxID=42251 RepID=A0A2T7A2L1_TUBBO|nr:ankyrin repeat-containing domain protein [Tuber borchii]